jgi:hypothetical protein
MELPMIEHPRVTFVVPCYNYGHYVGHAIDSLLAQTFEALEVIAIDDASTDDSRQVLERYADDPRVRLVLHERNQGHIRSYNEGIALARGEFVGLLSADDLCIARDAVARQVDVFDAHPNVGFVYSSYCFVDGTGKVTYVWQPWDADYVRGGVEEFAELISKNYIPASGTLVRRSGHEALGVYDPDLPHAGDWELWLRLCTRYEVGYILDPLYAYRTHDSNMNHAKISPAEGNRQCVLTMQKAFDALPATAPAALRGMRRTALQRAWLLTSAHDRTRGFTRRSWQGLLDAARQSPSLLVAPRFHAALLRLVLLTVFGQRSHERLQSWENRLRRRQIGGNPARARISRDTHPIGATQ